VTEWALKTDVSTPAASSSNFSHLAMVLDVTALYGLMRARNSFDSVPRIGAVRSSYARKVTTGHSPGSCGKDGKKNSVIGFPHLDCLASLLGERPLFLAHIASHTGSAGIGQLTEKGVSMPSTLLFSSSVASLKDTRCHPRMIEVTKLSVHSMYLCSGVMGVYH